MQQAGRLQIRRATQEDRVAVERLAALDTARLVGGETLVAEVDGDVRAALPLASGRAIADPFEPTAHLVALLELRARQLDADPRHRRARRLLVEAVPALGRHA
jgi:hypothetical protein